MPCHRPFLTQSYAFSHVGDDMAAVFFLIGRIKLSHKAVSTVKIRTAYYKRKPYRATMPSMLDLGGFVGFAVVYQMIFAVETLISVGDIVQVMCTLYIPCIIRLCSANCGCASRRAGCSTLKHRRTLSAVSTLHAIPPIALHRRVLADFRSCLQAFATVYVCNVHCSWQSFNLLGIVMCSSAFAITQQLGSQDLGAEA